MGPEAAFSELENRDGRPSERVVLCLISHSLRGQLERHGEREKSAFYDNQLINRVTVVSAGKDGLSRTRDIVLTIVRMVNKCRRLDGA